MHSKLLAVAAAAALVGLSATSGQAQSRYPERPITVVVPAAAGGPSDTVARLVGQAMTPALGQQIVIENKGGAGGSLGAGDVAKAAPDGYTLLLYHIGVATFAPLYPKLPYKPEEFSPVGLVTEVPMVLVGRSDLKANTLPELLALLKEKGTSLTIGTAGWARFPICARCCWPRRRAPSSWTCPTRARARPCWTWWASASTSCATRPPIR